MLNPHAFGHPGAGGSLGFADPDAKVDLGYTMNQMGTDPRLDPGGYSTRYTPRCKGTFAVTGSFDAARSVNDFAALHYPFS